MSLKKNRNAFTLVELLVVIAIIGVLAALLLPAVNAARGAARKTECVNNMRNVAQAMLNYESSQGQLPPFAKELGSGANNNLHVAGMVYSILPQIEKSVIRDEIDDLIAGGAENLSGLRGSTTLKILNCPSNPSISQAGSPIGYVANGARFHPSSNTIDRLVGLSRANGGLSAQISDPMLTGSNDPRDHANYAVTLDYISSRDGTSQTALVSENVRYQTSNWIPRSFASESSLALRNVLDEQSMVWSAGLQGSWNNAYADARPFGSFNQDLTPPGSSIDAEVHSTPSSFHSAGFVVGFADSHVSFVTSNIDYHVYAGMLSSDGRGVSPSAVDNAHYQKLQISAADISN